MSKGLLIAGGILLSLIVGLFAGSQGFQELNLGSVAVGGEYFSTTTGALIPLPNKLLVTGPGALGSVVITGALAGEINFYNATTTNVNFRTGQKPTSSIWIAAIPASTAAGTYTFDANFTNGLLLDLPTNATIPTSTITWHIY